MPSDTAGFFDYLPGAEDPEEVGEIAADDDSGEFDMQAGIAFDPDATPEEKSRALKAAIKACMSEYGDDE